MHLAWNDPSEDNIVADKLVNTDEETIEEHALTKGIMEILIVHFLISSNIPACGDYNCFPFKLYFIAFLYLLH